MFRNIVNMFRNLFCERYVKMPPRMSESQASVQLIMPKKAKATLTEYAKSKKKSISQLIRESLEEYFEKRGVDFGYEEGVRTWKRGEGEQE